MVQFLALLDDFDGGLDRQQILVDFILFLLVPKQLLLKLVLPCYQETAFSSQRHRHADSIQLRFQRLFAPSETGVSIAIGNDDVTITDLLEGVLLVDQLVEGGKDGDLASPFLEFLGVLEEHVEEGRVS